MNGERSDNRILKSVGIIRSPYGPGNAPTQPVRGKKGDFRLVVNKEYEDGLDNLSGFRYIYVLYLLDEVVFDGSMEAHPPMARGLAVGLFASRSPRRPNPIGLSVVEVMGIEGNVIRIDSIDAYNDTPVIDIKPYIKWLDCKENANNGWVEAFGPTD